MSSQASFRGISKDVPGENQIHRGTTTMHLRRNPAGSRHAITAGWMVIAILFGMQALAAEPAPRRNAKELLAIRLQAAGGHDREWRARMLESRTSADFCVRCHGENGESVTPLVPNLAGQNPYYLLEQIEMFADGRRKDFIMSPLARQISQEDKIAVVFYFSSMPGVRKAADPVLAGEGAVLYGQRCLSCHGREAHGSDRYARLAGQHPAYLKRRLEEFRNAAGNSTSAMTGIAQTLSEKEMDGLAAYLSAQP